MARLGDVCVFFSGTGFPNVFQGRHSGKYPFYKVGDISKNVLLGNRELVACDNYIDDDIVKEIKGFILPPQTVVFAKIGEALRLNRRAITQNYCLIDNNAMGIKANNDVLDTLYFYYFMCNVDLQHYCESTTVPSVRKTRIAEIDIPLPPLDEQRKIAAVLDKVSDLIAKRRQQLDKLDEMVKSRFVELFGDLADPNCKYMRYKLEEICVSSDDIKCGPFGAQLNKNEYQEHGIAVWEIPQINSEFKILPTHFLTSEKAKQLDAYSLIPGDIAMSRKGNVGRCALFPKGFAPGIIHSDVLRIRVDNSRVNPCFLMYQLHFSKAVTHQIEMVSSGAVMAGINVTKLKQIYIHIPAFNLQQQFSTFAEQVKKTKTTISRSLEQLETLKKALMQEYFGEKIC